MDVAAYRAAEARLWQECGNVPRERVVRLARLGVSIRVMELGTADAPAVLFVHGGPSGGSIWAPVAGRLEGFRVLVLDRPGSGLSEEPYPLTRRNVRTYLENLVVDALDALDVERAHLVGSSTGSDCILLAAAGHPERVDRSVHFGCPGLAPGMDMPLLWRLVALPGMWRLMAAMPAGEQNVRTSLRQMGHGAALDAGRISQAAIEWAVSLQRDTDTFRNELQASRAMVSLRGVPKDVAIRREELARIQSPTCFVWGERDQFGGPEIGRAMVDEMPDARLEIVPQGGHLAWLDDAERAVAVVEGHLGDGAASGAAQASTPGHAPVAAALT